jgi:hypothetical protein
MISKLEKCRKSVATPAADKKSQFPDSVIPRHSPMIKKLRLCQKPIPRPSLSVFLGVSRSWSDFILMPCQNPVSPRMSQNLPGSFLDFIEECSFLAKYTDFEILIG